MDACWSRGQARLPAGQPALTQSGKKTDVLLGAPESYWQCGTLGHNLSHPGSGEGLARPGQVIWEVSEVRRKENSQDLGDTLNFPPCVLTPGFPLGKFMGCVRLLLDL